MQHLKEGNQIWVVFWWLSSKAHFGWELEREVDGKTPQLEGEPQLILITKQLWAGSDNNTSEMDLAPLCCEWIGYGYGWISRRGQVKITYRC